MPRPSDAKYLAFTAEAIKDARARENADGMPPMQLDALGAIATYWNLIPHDDKKDADRGCQGRRQVLRVAAGQLGLGARSRPS